MKCNRNKQIQQSGVHIMDSILYTAPVASFTNMV